MDFLYIPFLGWDVETINPTDWEGSGFLGYTDLGANGSRMKSGSLLLVVRNSFACGTKELAQRKKCLTAIKIAS